MFFSIKSSIKIGNKVYTPCVCYEASEVLIPTIEKLVAEGKAYKYEERVYFQNGKVIEKKSGTSLCDECNNNLGKGVCLGNSKNEMVDTTGEGKCFEKKSKKAKKEKTVPVDETEEDIPSPEEVADNIGEF